MTSIQMPQMKKELGVRDFNERYRWITINSTNDAIQEYARFDFGEVLAWLMAHGEEVEVSE